MNNDTRPQIFVSYSSLDEEIVKPTLEKIKQAPINLFDPHQGIKVGDMPPDAVRDGIVAAHGYLVFWTPNAAKSGWTAFELGAAAAWEKPMFVAYLKDGPPAPIFTDLVRRYPLPLANPDELIRDLTHTASALSPTDVDALKKAYLRIAIPTDSLLMHRESAAELARQFKVQAKRAVSSDILLQELVRLRKQGLLPKLSARRSSGNRTAD